MNDYSAVPYLLLEDLLPLAIAAAILVIAILRIKKEARRYSNAVLLAAALIFFLRRLARFYINNNWHEVPTADGNFYLTNESPVLNWIIIILLLSFFAVGIWMIFIGITLVRKEGWTTTHALSIFFGIMSLSLPFAIFMLMEAESGVYGGLPPFLTFFVLEGFYVPFCCFAYFLYSFIYLHLKRKMEPDYIIILGASLSGKRCTPLLARRVDRALEVWNKNEGRPILIPSGGQGKDEEVSEAFAMHTYLSEHSVPEDKIIEENKSANTWQNMQFSKAIMDERSGVNHYVSIFSTNDFHVYRSAVYARAVGCNADGVGCKTAGYYFPSAILREILAFILRYRKFAAIYMICAAAYTFIEIFFPYLTTFLN